MLIMGDNFYAKKKPLCIDLLTSTTINQIQTRIIFELRNCLYGLPSIQNTKNHSGKKQFMIRGYNRTCIKRHRIQRSPRINRSVLEVPNFFPTVIFTSIKRSRSPFFKVPTACFYYLPTYWTVTESRITQKKKKIFNPFFSTKIKVSSIFERDSVHQVVSHSLNNTHEKMTRLWLAENECIFHVTRLQITKNAHAAKISSLYLQILIGWKEIAYEKFEKVLRGAAAWVSYSWKGFSPPALAFHKVLQKRSKIA